MAVDVKQVQGTLLKSIEFCAELCTNGSSPRDGRGYAASARDLAEAYRLLTQNGSDEHRQQ
jgi:hypothetical protein